MGGLNRLLLPVTSLNFFRYLVTNLSAKIMNKIIKVTFVLTVAFHAVAAQSNFSKNPDSVGFHTEDIAVFWKVFDKTSPGFDAKSFQEEYIDVGR